MMHPGARAQIRSARLSSGLSLRELGRRTGVTASLLSQIENGKSDPSVSTLSALVSELGLSLDALFRPDHSHDLNGSEPNGARMNGHGRGSRLNGSTTNGHASNGHASNGSSRNGNGLPHLRPVIRPPERQTLDLDSGVVWERLTRGPSDQVDALLVTYRPGATSSSGGKLLRHDGIEHAYLMSGELTLHLGFETHVLRAGDSLEFDGATPHVYCNQSDVPARGLWFVLGRNHLPAQPGPYRMLDLAELPAGEHRTPSAVDSLGAFSRD